MKTKVALLFCGLCWTALAYGLGVTRGEIGIPLVCGLVTSFVVWSVVSFDIQNSRGWQWFALPFFSLVVGILVFVSLIQVAWWLRDVLFEVQPRYSHINGYWLGPFVCLFYALTIYIWIIYPLSLLTHYLLRKYAIPHTAEPGATANR
jgi:hypothetical protein